MFSSLVLSLSFSLFRVLIFDFVLSLTFLGSCLYIGPGPAPGGKIYAIAKFVNLSNLSTIV
jgi:hypothetical protein